MPDYCVEQELVQFGEGSLTFLEPRFWPTSDRPRVDRFGKYKRVCRY